MHRKINVLLIVFLLASVLKLTAQDLSIKIVDNLGEGIPYVNLYSEQSDYGTVSDQNGHVLIESSLID